MNLEQEHNNKHPKQNIKYAGRCMPQVCPTCHAKTISKQIPIDVRNFIIPVDVVLKETIELNKLKGSSHDETMHNIQKWVVKNIIYVPDEVQQGTLEYWQFPFETMFSKKGDCEDGAILIASLAIACGIPSWRVRVVGGLVVPHNETAPSGGHGYCTYLRETDDHNVIIDWCYYEDSKLTVTEKPLYKTNKLYGEVFFSFNNKYSWGKNSLTVDARLSTL